MIPDSLIVDDYMKDILRGDFRELVFATLLSCISRKETSIRIEEWPNYNEPSEQDIREFCDYRIVGDDGSALTRREAATILADMVRYCDLTPFETYRVDFNDVDSLAVSAKADLAMLSGIWIINGVGDGKFSPDSALTIEQAIAAMWRFLCNVTNFFEELDGGRYCYRNAYFTWFEESGEPVFMLPREKYYVMSFQNAGGRRMIAAIGSTGIYGTGTTRPYNERNNDAVFSYGDWELLVEIPHPYKIFYGPSVFTHDGKYIIVTQLRPVSFEENPYGSVIVHGVLDFSGELVMPVEHSLADLYEAGYLATPYG